MEYVSGQDAGGDTETVREPMSDDETLNIITPILETLSKLQKRG